MKYLEIREIKLQLVSQPVQASLHFFNTLLNKQGAQFFRFKTF